MSFWKQRKVRRTVAAISITAMLMGMCVVPKFHISASTQKTGTITTEWIVETKKEPSPSAVKANGLEDGKKVTIYLSSRKDFPPSLAHFPPIPLASCIQICYNEGYGTFGEILRQRERLRKVPL